MGAPGERLRDGRWAPGTLVRDTDRRLCPGAVPYATDIPDHGWGDSVFVQSVGRPERPWQLWSSSALTAIPDQPQPGS